MCSAGVRSPARTRAHRRDWQGAEWSASPCTCPAGLRRAEERVTMKDPVGNAVLETGVAPMWVSNVCSFLCRRENLKR